MNERDEKTLTNRLANVRHKAVEVAFPHVVFFKIEVPHQVLRHRRYITTNKGSCHVGERLGSEYTPS